MVWEEYRKWQEKNKAEIIQRFGFAFCIMGLFFGTFFGMVVPELKPMVMPLVILGSALIIYSGLRELRDAVKTEKR